MFLGDRQAKRFLQEVILGFNKCLLAPHKKKGRPRKNINVDEKEYIQLQKQLMYHGIWDFDLLELKRYQKDSSINKDWLFNWKRDMLQKRVQTLARVLKEHQIPCSEEEIAKLVRKYNSEIALYIYAKKKDTSPVTIKRRLASEFPRWETRNVLGWVVPIRKKRSPHKLDHSRNKTPKN